jgi:hypothetical protein
MPAAFGKRQHVSPIPLEQDVPYVHVWREYYVLLLHMRLQKVNLFKQVFFH